MSARWCLRRDLIVEPLIGGWYAWLLLLSPLSRALLLARQQLPLLESFMREPQLHAAALANPQMAGGPFVDLPAAAQPAVRELAARTRARCAEQLALAEQWIEFNEQLLDEAVGDSLAPLWSRVPVALDGVLSLAYDTADQPVLRVFEALLYDDPLYDRGAQSIELYCADADARSFVLSTPRLRSEERLRVGLPFDDVRLDRLFAARGRALDELERDELAEELGLDRVAFARMFELAMSEPALEPEPRPASPRVRYLGHACVLIEDRETTLLVDPLIPSAGSSEVPRLCYEQLPARIDYALITHGHQDHLVLETLLQLRGRIETVVVPRASGAVHDPSLALALRAVGFAKVVELGPLASLELPRGRLTALPFLGEHGDLDVEARAGYHVELEGRTIALVADSDNLSPALYDRLARRLGPLDHLFIGMECEGAPMSWLYGPLMLEPPARAHDQRRRLNGSNFARAWRLIESLGPRGVTIYAMAAEPWLGFVSGIRYTAESLPIVESEALIERCRSAGIPCARPMGLTEIEL